MNSIKKKKMKKLIKSILTIFIVIFIFFAIIALTSLVEPYQLMRNLDYNVSLNDDGSMRIIETWDIDVKDTNTLFRNFDKLWKYGEITDVKVKDLKTGEEFEQIYEEMYHVTTGCFYALEISGGKFEIAWGTGMEHSTGNKRYEISYTVKDVITEYDDCEELYWQLLSSDNAIKVKKVTGTVTLPKEVENIDNLKVWGHGPLNGTINKASNNTVKFEVDDLPAGKMLEIRVATAENVFDDISEEKTKLYPYLNTITSQEQKWGEEVDNAQIGWRFFVTVLVVIYAVIIIKNIINIVSAYKRCKKDNDGIVYTKLDYYRDIPREGISTPGEAQYLYNFKKIENDNYQSEVVAATILDLALKRYISLRCEEDKVYVKILKNPSDLKPDEKAIYDLLKNAGDSEDEFELDQLNKYAKKAYTKYSELINKMINSSRENLYNEKLIDKSEQKEYKKAISAKNNFDFMVGVIKVMIIGFLVTFIPFINKGFMIMFSTGYRATLAKIILVLLPLIILLLVKYKILNKTQSKIAVLTQKGADEIEQWKGLYKYMTDYSLLKEKDVTSLEIWEKYLVFATAFGISEKVIEQMKAEYPEVFVKEYWQDEKVEQYPIINFSIYSSIYRDVSIHTPMINSLQSQVNDAYHTSLREIANHSSSSGGSGGGGGFSGGGGGRRRRRSEWAEDNRPPLKKTKAIN